MLTPAAEPGLLPFEQVRLDRLMDEAGVDLLLATAKHNVQYLLGGHRPLFFEYMDATGLSRYLPVLVYPRGRPQQAAYIGHRLESYQREIERFWTPEVRTVTAGTRDAMAAAADHVRRIGAKPRRIAAELAYLPADAAAVLRDAFPDCEIVDAQFILERLRAVKRPDELAKLRVASDLVIESMLAVIAASGPGTTKAAFTEALRREETGRGLNFDYCLIAAGTSFNRAPSDQPWQPGEVLSVDSGGNYHGYIGDVSRMAILGEPDAELDDLLAEIETIQRAAMRPVRAGNLGSEIYAAAEPLLRRSSVHNHMHFLAHGMGLTSHEAPRLTGAGPVPYDAYDAERPLEAGMVISVETTLEHPRRGFIKLEDTLAVTATGFEIYGEGGRGWNRGGTAVGAPR